MSQRDAAHGSIFNLIEQAFANIKSILQKAAAPTADAIKAAIVSAFNSLSASESKPLHNLRT